MNDLAKMFVNPYVIIYLLIVIGGQMLYTAWYQWSRKQIAKHRRTQGLPEDIFLNHAERLSERRREALLESGILAASIIIVPFILIYIAGSPNSDTPGKEQQGLALVFVALLFWVMISGTEVAKVFLSGLAFKTLTAFKNPFQVGDRVTLKGVGGKVIGIDTFFVTLQTPDDDQVSIPTASLWNETMYSVNAGDRSSLCVMNFYLAPFVTVDQRQAAEDTIWDAIQSSVYYDPTKPMQIFLSQNQDSIQLTAKSYVASTYNEPLFSSDVTRAFLEFAAKHRIALASQSWRASVKLDT
jgi:small-conductance mechanosensitive channel